MDTPKRILAVSIMLGLALLLAGPLAAGRAEARVPPKVTAEQLMKMKGETNVVVIDLRNEQELRSSEEAIPGAVHLVPAKVADWAKELDKGQVYVLYCQGAGDKAAETCALDLRERGFEEVYILRDGFNGYKQGGHPITRSHMGKR